MHTGRHETRMTVQIWVLPLVQVGVPCSQNMARWRAENDLVATTCQLTM